MTIVMPVSRARALTRAVVWAVPAVLGGLITILIYSRLHFVPTAVSNRLVDYSIAFICLPVPISCLIAIFRMLRWLLLAAWPGAVVIVANESALTFSLGPFGTKAYDAARMVIRYPFELLEDENSEGAFESFLPEEEQLRVLLPRITHPSSAKPLNELLLRFVDVGETHATKLLRPALEHWRAMIAGTLAGTEGDRDTE